MLALLISFPLIVSGAGSPAAAAGAIAPVTWGTPNGGAKALVLYDDAPGDTFGWLGELSAIGVGNLSTHFGMVTAEPVSEYTAGQMDSYTALLYAGTTYDEKLPAAFITDVLSGKKPVLWIGDNVWQLDNPGAADANSAAITAASFESQYGWDPASSNYSINVASGAPDNVAAVTYEGRTFTRNAADGSMLVPHITNPAMVNVLAQAQCSSATTSQLVACSPLDQVNGADTFPWAIRSRNLLFVDESPFNNANETDRYLIFADLLFDVLDPSAPPLHQAIVRLEDVNPTTNPVELKQFALWMYSQNIAFTVIVIPDYVDPTGYLNGGHPQNVTLPMIGIAKASDCADNGLDQNLVQVLEWVQCHGDTVDDHGLTHQYSTVANPYDAVSADDFEFYRAQCSTTAPPATTLDPSYATSTPATLAAGTSPCPITDWVYQEGPVPNDSTAWAAARAATAQQLFVKAGLTAPTIWTTPHYSASAADYVGIDETYKIRYERVLYFAGQLTGGPVNSSVTTGHVLGMYYPYVVHDLYGETIVPEDLGNYEPIAQNNNPPRSPAQMVAEAKNDLAVRQGVASFFFHPYYPLTDLEQTIRGIQADGYSYVSPATLIGNQVSSVSNATKS